MHMEVDVYLHTFLNSVLDRGECLVSPYNDFTTGEITPGSHRIEAWIIIIISGVGLSPLGTAATSGLYCPCLEWNPSSLGLIPIPTDLSSLLMKIRVTVKCWRNEVDEQSFVWNLNILWMEYQHFIWFSLLDLEV
jgi:hypothetical protein